MQKFFVVFFMIFFCIHAGEVVEPDELLHKCKKIEEDPYFHMVRNALSQTSPHQVGQNWDCIRKSDFCFSHEVKPSFKITNQQRSGRCWMFAALNVLRTQLGKKVSLQEFEFSQSFLYFYDKIEKANFFLEKIIETYQEALHSQALEYFLDDPIPEGGDWHMLASLVNKYGLVPKSVYPESNACICSITLNTILRRHLLKSAISLREYLHNGSSIDTVQKIKDKILEELYQILVVHMGTPPEEFTWSYYDNEKQLQTCYNLTPKGFYEEFIDVDLNDYTYLIHSPQIDTPYYQSYLISYSSCMVGGENFQGLNLPIEEIKSITKKSVMKGDPVYFAGDISQQADCLAGILDANLYEFDTLYQIDFAMSKAQRIQYRVSIPNHAMVFNGVHIENDQPIRWKVENSWGAIAGKKGYFVMSDSWFDEYLYEVVVHKKYLPENVKVLLALDPVVINPWENILWTSCYQK